MTDIHIILETPRLTLRQFTEGDVDNLFDLNSDPEVMRYLTGGKSTPREVIREQIIPFHLSAYRCLDRLGTWAAEATATGEFLGWFHLRPDDGTDITNVELGYRLRRPAWNKGYATEGSRALIDMAFTDLGVERVFARTMTVNLASRRVLEKCGLTPVRTTPYHGADVIEGAEHGEVEYALTRPERGRFAVTDAPPLADEDDLVAVAAERETLEGFLEYHRRVVGGKLRGLSEDEARRRLVPSLTTMLGLVSHAAAVERNWFQHYLGGQPREEITGNARGDAPSWDVGADRTIAGVIAEFDRACAASRQIAAGFALDQTVPHDQLGRVSLRWIYVHIIREHARHIGHADILREQIDGTTGD